LCIAKGEADIAMSPKILVVGANGFIGRELCAELVRRQYSVAGTARRVFVNEKLNYPLIRIADIGAETDWSVALQNIDVVIHLAARVHVMRDEVNNSLSEFRRVNTAGTEHLARCAAEAGVKRVVFVSSIGVNGAETIQGHPFVETCKAAPNSPYAVSKWEAEQCLREVSATTGLEVVVIRPPLVYGGDAPGNFMKLLKILSKRLPLPLASIRNLRSFIYVGNFVDALIVCATHPDAAGQTYLVSDGEDISTPDLLRRLGDAMGFSARLLPFPVTLLWFVGCCVGKSEQIVRLVASLQIDISKIRRELGWQPPYTFRQGIDATAERYMECNGLGKIEQ
jgi:nucleoside-diphosphate-sugar epimerase